MKEEQQSSMGKLKRGRPKLFEQSTVISVRVPASWHAQLVRQAQFSGITVGEQTRRLLIRKPAP